MEDRKVYSLIGIGIGPFNLGLAALLEPVDDVSSLFFDQKEQFNWHPVCLLTMLPCRLHFYATVFQWPILQVNLVF
nr:lysine N(6)-hydroxylase/L-ornithine N(5)-oxygenase family protein [Flavobacterium sp. N2038]